MSSPAVMDAEPGRAVRAHAHPAASTARRAEVGAPGSVLEPPPPELPFYAQQGDEVELFAAAFAQRLPVLLKGPTGCGKTRFVRHMAGRLGRPLVTVACHDELAATDLIGRFLVTGGETLWQDGPLTAAVRAGAICYLDEIVEARADTVIVIHPLADDRRVLAIEKRGELLHAHPDFQLVVSYNPGYRSSLKELRASTRQRFVALEFDYPAASLEIEVLRHEAGVDEAMAARLAQLGHHVRRLRDHGLAEVASTRVLVHAGRLIGAGIAPCRACEIAIARALTDDVDLSAAIAELVRAVFP